MGRHPRRPFWYLRRPRRVVRADIDEEIRVHLEMRSDALQRDGMAADEARREALRRFGDVEAARKYCESQHTHKETAMHRRLMWQDVFGDVRVAVRSLLRVPVLTLTIVATVGLGIGATTVIFSGVNAALLRPLPYADPERLAWIYLDSPPFMFRFSVADYLALESQQTQFERVAGFTSRSMTFSDGTSASLLTGRQVSWTYFGVLGVTPALGRDFTADDGRPGSPPAVIVSHAFWQQRLGARADVVGQPIRLDGAEYALTGVLPPGLGPLERRQEFFIAAQFATPPRRGPFPYWVIGRLRPGVDHAAAASELGAIAGRLFPIWRSSYQDEKATWSLLDLEQQLVGGFATTGALALAAVALVWLIACANASSLLVARVTSRQRELAVRAALGASRARVIRHLLVESAVLASGAAVLAGGLAWLGVGLLRDVGASYFPRTQEIAFDGPVLALLAALTVMSALVFGLIPALQTARGSDREVLTAGERSSTGGVAARRLRRVLVGSQFAIATPLLIVAALLLVSLDAMRTVDLGFDGRPLITGSIRLPGALYRDAAAATYWSELQRRLQALPGVAGVAFSDSRPPDTASNINNFDLEQFPTPPGESQPATPFVAATPEFPAVFGLQLLEGRWLTAFDAERETLESVVVDRAWARRFFPNESAVGKRFKEGGCTECPWTAVVGVVSDVQYVGLDQPNLGTVYTPMQPGLTRFVALRAHADPAALAPVLGEVMRELDPAVPLTDMATIDELVDQSLQQPQALSLLVAAFASVALLLSLVGIYGVMAYYVQQHAKEIGIRLALGGSAGAVLRMIVGQGMTVVSLGVVAGLLIALAATRLVSSLLFGVGARDATTYAAVGLFLALAALVACLLPARRAVRLEPAMVLRE
jgi:putative ABC transport system permease protein